MRRLLLLAALLVASAATYIYVTLPPRAVQVSTVLPPNVVLGGYHIHSTRSDGTGTVDEIAAAASRAGLAFIILTDHGDATRVPDPPTYRHGVICIDAVEISTSVGHLVAVGLDGAAPYPLAGEPEDVLDDVHRLGGIGIVAHPDSPKPGLRWQRWTVAYDGVEWLNADSEWRDDSIVRLAGTLVRYALRPAEVTASLFLRPVPTLRRWDSATAERAVLGLAGLDAHGGLSGDRQTRRRTIVSWPSQEGVFKTLAQAAILDAPLSGSATADAVRVVGALRAGHTFSLVRAFATPASLDFSATMGDVTARMGDRLPRAGGSPVSFHAAVPGVPTARVALLHNGAEVAAGEGGLTFSAMSQPGAYRVEVFYPGETLPWILSNPIYLGAGRAPVDVGGRPVPASGQRVAAAGPVTQLPAGGTWGIEKDPASSWDVQAEGREWRFAFGLGGGAPAGQYSALVSSADDQTACERVMFTARADRPMRVAVQVRLPTGERWRRSVYVDSTPQTFSLSLQDFRRIGEPTGQLPIVAHVRAVLFVVDTLNTATGTRGTLWIKDAALGLPGRDPR